jgi:hypothetical protein
MHGTVLSRTGDRQEYPLGPLLFNLAINTPLRNIEERCKDSSATQAFSDDGRLLVTTPFVPIVIAVATEELGKVCLRVQPIKFSCMVPLDTSHELVEVTRAKVPVVTNIYTLGAPLTMDLSMTDGPPASHNENYVHFCTCDLSLDDHVCGTPLWVLTPHRPP